MATITGDAGNNVLPNAAMRVERMESGRAVIQNPRDIPPGTSWKKTTGVMISLVLFCGGCVSTGELFEPANIQGPLPQGTRSVVIRAMPMNSGTIKNAEKLSLIDAPPLFARYLKDALALKQPGCHTCR